MLAEKVEADFHLNVTTSHKFQGSNVKNETDQIMIKLQIGQTGKRADPKIMVKNFMKKHQDQETFEKQKRSESNQYLRKMNK